MEARAWDGGSHCIRSLNRTGNAFSKTEYLGFHKTDFWSAIHRLREAICNCEVQGECTYGIRDKALKGVPVWKELKVENVTERKVRKRDARKLERVKKAV